MTRAAAAGIICTGETTENRMSTLDLDLHMASRPGWARRAWNGLQLAFTLAWTAGLITLALIVRVLTLGQRWPLRMAARCWAPGLLGGAGAMLVVEGADRIDWSKPCILASNHQSIIDICVLFRAVPVPLRFVLKQEMTRVPFVGWYAKATGMVFIDRGKARDAQRNLLAIADRLRGGQHLCVFPEGTRSRDGQVGTFKSGPFQLAIQAGVPVVPVAMEGTGHVVPPHGFEVRPGTIRVRFGTPIPTDQLVVRDRQTLARQAHDAVVSLLQRG